MKVTTLLVLLLLLLLLLQSSYLQQFNIKQLNHKNIIL